MKKVMVKVMWLHPEEGGRKVLPKGEHYTTTVKFPHQTLEQWTKNAWSIRLDWLDKDAANGWYGLAHFPADGSPETWLVPGGNFELYEGPKAIGKVDVISTAKAVENIGKIAA